MGVQEIFSIFKIIPPNDSNVQQKERTNEEQFLNLEDYSMLKIYKS